ncbi:MAG: MBL fold metallo-hydrolase [Halioglobus sp.]
MKKFSQLLISISLLGIIPAHAAEDAPSVSTSPIKGALHLLQGRGGNVVASVGADGILIIDDDFAAYADAYQRALNKLVPGSDDAQVPQFVINTHWHGDHTGGNLYWGDKGSVIVAHSNVRARMSTRQEMKVSGRVVEASPAAALPVVTYGDSMALHFNDDDIEILHLPTGHTDGDSVVFFAKANVVHMGDHFFMNSFPFVDLGSGGNVAGFTANISAVLDRVDDTTIIIPGHGGKRATKKDLQRYHEMLVTTVKSVSVRMEKGQTQESIVEDGLDDKWASWGQGFINEEMWIKTIAAGL